MNRLYAVETMPTTTGFKAEHRLALKASDVAAFAQAIAGAAVRAPRAALPTGPASSRNFSRRLLPI